MKFTFYHNNINVADLDKSIEFYKKALGLKITKETEAADGSFKLVFMGDDTTPHKFTCREYRSAHQLCHRCDADSAGCRRGCDPCKADEHTSEESQ